MCESYYPPLFEMTGVKFMCERDHDDPRSWHQYTNEKGQRTQWSWSKEEKAARKK